MRSSVRSLLMLTALAAPAAAQEGAASHTDTVDRVGAALTAGSNRQQLDARVAQLRAQLASCTDPVLRARVERDLAALGSALEAPAAPQRSEPAAQAATTPNSAAAPADAPVSFGEKHRMELILAIAALLAAALYVGSLGKRKEALMRLQEAEEKIKLLRRQYEEILRAAEKETKGAKKTNAELTEELKKNRADSAAELAKETEAKRKAEAEREELRAIAVREKNDNDAAQAALARAGAELIGAQERANLAQAQVKELELQAAELRQLAENSDSKKLADRLKESAQALLAANARLDAAQQDRQEAEHAYLGLKQQKEEKEAVAEAQILDLNSRLEAVIAKAETEARDAEAAQGDLAARLEAAAKSAREAEAAYGAALESAKSQAQDEQERLQAALAGAQAELAGANEARGAVQAELEAAVAKLGELELSRSDDHRRHGEVLAREVARLEGEIALAQGRVKAAEAATEGLRQRALAREAHLEAETSGAAQRHQEKIAAMDAHFAQKSAEERAQHAEHVATLAARAARELGTAKAQAEELRARLEATLERLSGTERELVGMHVTSAKKDEILKGLAANAERSLESVRQAAAQISLLEDRVALLSGNQQTAAALAQARLDAQRLSGESDEAVSALSEAKKRAEVVIEKTEELTSGTLRTAEAKIEAELSGMMADLRATEAEMMRNSRQAMGAMAERIKEHLDAVSLSVLKDKLAGKDVGAMAESSLAASLQEIIKRDPKVHGEVARTLMSLLTSKSGELARKAAGEIQASVAESVEEGKKQLGELVTKIAKLSDKALQNKAYVVKKLEAAIHQLDKAIAEAKEDRNEQTRLQIKRDHFAQMKADMENAQDDSEVVAILDDLDLEKLDEAGVLQDAGVPAEELENEEAPARTAPAKSALPQITAAVPRKAAQAVTFTARDAQRALVFVRKENSRLLAEAHSSPDADRLAQEGAMFERALHIAVIAAGEGNDIRVTDETLAKRVKEALEELEKRDEAVPAEDPHAGTRSYAMHTESEEIRKAKAGRTGGTEKISKPGEAQEPVVSKPTPAQPFVGQAPGMTTTAWFRNSKNLTAEFRHLSEGHGDRNAAALKAGAARLAEIRKDPKLAPLYARTSEILRRVPQGHILQVDTWQGGLFVVHTPDGSFSYDRVEHEIAKALVDDLGNMVPRHGSLAELVAPPSMDGLMTDDFGTVVLPVFALRVDELARAVPKGPGVPDVAGIVSGLLDTVEKAIKFVQDGTPEALVRQLEAAIAQPSPAAEPAKPAAPKGETSGWGRPAKTEPAAVAQPAAPVAEAPKAVPAEPVVEAPAARRVISPLPAQEAPSASNRVIAPAPAQEVPTAERRVISPVSIPAAESSARVADIHISMDEGSDAGPGESAGISGKHPALSASPDDTYLEFLKGTGTNLADIAVNRIFPSLPAGFSAVVTLGTKTLQIHRVEGAGSSHHFSMYASPLNSVEPEDRVFVSYLTSRSAPQAGNGWEHADSALAFKILVMAVNNWSRRVAERGAPAPGRHHHVGQILDALAQTAIQVSAAKNPKPEGKDKVHLANLAGARENLAVLWLRHHGKSGAQVADDLETFVIPSLPYNKPVDITIGSAKTQVRPSKDGYKLVDSVGMAEARELVGKTPQADQLRVNASVSALVVDASGTRELNRHHVVGALVMRVKAWSERIVLAGISKKEMPAVYLAATVASEIATKLRAMEHGGHEKLPEVIERLNGIVQEFRTRAAKKK